VSTPHVLDRPTPEPHRVERYAPGETGVVDVYLPRGPAIGGLVLVHGGFWRARYDRMHLRHLASALSGAGWRVALPEYRRVGDAGGGWPGSLNDIVAVAEAAGGMLGTRTLVLAGHSAGAHLAVLAAAAMPSPPTRVVSLAGVLDVRAAHEARLSEGAVAAFLGTSEPSPREIGVIDPMTTPLPSSDLSLVHGDRDADVPVGFSTRYGARDPRIRLDVVHGADHYDLIDPLSKVYPRVLGALGTAS
jgi:acetyl esterase/lipase